MSRRLVRCGCTLIMGTLLSFSIASVGPFQQPAAGQQQPPITLQPLAGVEVDAEGVLRTRQVVDPTGRLMRERWANAQASLDQDLLKPSEMRLVSLPRLEAEVSKLVASGQPIPDEMKYLAGITRITHVFLYPESGDIVIAGPAEGFFSDLTGRVIGMETGRAVVQLQDLVVALRAFNPSGRRTSLIACSIDPTQEGLQRLQQVYAMAQQRFRPGDEMAVVQAFANALGMQQVSIEGVSPQTHFAQVLVEADYRMKLIGIGLEQPPVRIVSFIERADPGTVAANALQRWYFQPDYESVRVSEDHLAMQLVGNGVQLVGEDERVAGDGTRVRARRGNAASRAFCQSFTENYPQLADRSPIFAELRNVIDMSIIAAFIQHADWYRQAGWNMELFGDESRFAVETYRTPKQVPPAINAVWKGRHFMTPIGGGVSIMPRRALAPEHLGRDEAGEVAESRSGVSLDHLAPGQWWWDR